MLIFNPCDISSMSIEGGECMQNYKLCILILEPFTCSYLGKKIKLTFAINV